MIEGLLLVVAIALGVFLGQVVTTTFSFYVNKFFARKRRLAEADALSILTKIQDEMIEKKKQAPPKEAGAHGQYL